MMECLYNAQAVAECSAIEAAMEAQELAAKCVLPQVKICCF